MMKRAGFLVFRRLLFFLAAVFLICGCNGAKIPSRQFIYELAVKSAQTHSLLPPGSKVLPIDKSILSIGKNAARVDLAYDAGNGKISFHSICLKRVARTWTYERSYPTPVYNSE